MTSPQDLIEFYARLGELIALKTVTVDDALAAVTMVAVDVVGGVSCASITRDRGDHFQTLVPTAPLASAGDRLQYELNSGPCVDAARAGGSVASPDIGLDPRWPEFGPEVARRFGVRSMMSLGMVIDGEIRAGLNLYSLEPNLFDAATQSTAMLMATHGAMAVSRVAASERADGLEKALLSSRMIGTAIGILMSSRKLSADQAFAVLRIESQTSNRRLVVVADEVNERGELGR